MSCLTPFDIGSSFDPTSAPKGHGLRWDQRNHYVGDCFCKCTIVVDAHAHELDGENLAGTSRTLRDIPSVLIESHFNDLPQLKRIFDAFAPDGDRSFYTEDGRPAEYLSTVEKTIFSYDPVRVLFYFPLDTSSTDMARYISFACELFPQLFHHGYIAAFMSVLHNHYIVFHSHNYSAKSLSLVVSQCSSKIWSVLFRLVFDTIRVLPWFRLACPLYDTFQRDLFTEASINRIAPTDSASRGHMLVAALADFDEQFRGPPRCRLEPVTSEEIGMSTGDDEFGVLVHAWMCLDRRETFYQYLRTFRF